MLPPSNGVPFATSAYLVTAAHPCLLMEASDLSYMIKSILRELIASGSDWRYLNAPKKDLKALKGESTMVCLT
jgi:hypothetical protein